MEGLKAGLIGKRANRTINRILSRVNGVFKRARKAYGRQIYSETLIEQGNRRCDLSRLEAGHVELSADAFDGQGNYSLGLSEQLVFPELNPDKYTRTQGMNITRLPSGSRQASCASAEAS